LLQIFKISLHVLIRVQTLYHKNFISKKTNVFVIKIGVFIPSGSQEINFIFS